MLQAKFLAVVKLDQLICNFFSDGNIGFIFRSWAAKTQVNLIKHCPSLQHVRFVLTTKIYAFVPCRSLDDVRMNLEVLKHCATVLLLVCKQSNYQNTRIKIWNNHKSHFDYMDCQESSLPNVLSSNRNLGNMSMVTRSRANGNSCGEEASRKSPPTNFGTQRAVPYQRDRLGKVPICRSILIVISTFAYPSTVIP